MLWLFRLPRHLVVPGPQPATRAPHQARRAAGRARALAAFLVLSVVPAAHTATAGTGAASAPETAGPTILVLGDSISAGYGIQRGQGWVSRLRERLATRGDDWHVVNASVSGETTGGALARLPGALTEHDPEVVIIELGGNDGLRGYPVARIRENLRRMVVLCREAGARPLLVGMQIPPNYGPRYTRAFADVFTEVAETEDTALVPFMLEQVALVPELMQSDGIHPTAAAQDALLDTVWPHLVPLLERHAAGAAPSASTTR